jgi:ferritin-like metal-binding protein YciE
LATMQVDVIRRYLEDAIAAERSFETQLRGFATEGDDEEVRSLFAAHAEETHLQHRRLTTRLEELGGSPSAGKSLLAHLFALTPKSAQLGHNEDERTVQNLMIAYTVEHGERAMYHALIGVAEAAMDAETAQLAREIQEQETATAEKIWQLIPTRAKIAFNMLTVAETDPAVVTRATEDRLV